ncbi:unnamed protein product [Brassica napus]|uniref:(rape) hypothetical protein n=1 Tax=Brassica napus TaxID=3708 RepID=A0A816Q8X7_BRANA|nr:unnamed protein product [Brassica napus]
MFTIIIYFFLLYTVHQVLRRELDMVENEKKECISNFSKIAHNPIFFHSPFTYPFTVGLWKIFIGNQLDINPSSASEKIFILQLFTYNMWREHNCRTFRQTSSMKDKLFSIPAKSSTAHSMLEI